MLYAQSTGGFYDVAIHGQAIPSDAVEITTDEYEELLSGQSAGKRIIADADGRPMLAEPAPPTAAEIQQRQNADARAYLSSTDWYLIRRAETGEAVPADILEARVAARALVIE